jgi:ribosomal protein S18 acetylase RimI-like enzyme
MIRRLGESDAEAYVKLRREALLDSPLAFVSSPEDDMAASVGAVREQLRKGDDSVLFGAFAPDLVGAVGLYRDRHVKAAHKVHIWGMYVAPAARRQGLAAELLAAVLRHARSMHGVSWAHLCVSETASEAKRLYERAGYRVWGTQPDALRHGGRTVSEDHMALCLEHC